MPTATLSNGDFSQEHQIRKAKIYEETHDLLSESDLYCSFMVLDEERPLMQIIGAEREYEKEMLSDGDVLYVNQGKNDGLEAGQLYLILDIQDQIPGYGPLAFKRGRARIVALSENKASAVIENSCGDVRLGHYLVSFDVREGVIGKDLGFMDVPPFEVKGAKGEVVYLQTNFNQVGAGHWALIDQGEDDGIQAGQQLVTFRIIEEGAPLQIFGNVVVIDVQKSTSTVKVLSCRDALRIGDLLMEHPSE